MRNHIRLALLTLMYASLHSRAKILRNNALMSKMISHFQQDNNLSLEPRENQGRERKIDKIQNVEPKQDSLDQQKPDKILNLMQNVLCRNFPSIPCKIIMQDEALNKLIERSIQQITYKKLRMDKTNNMYTTIPPYDSQTLFPLINSEELSNFLEVSNTGSFNEKAKKAKHKQKKKRKSITEQKLKNHWSQEKPSKKKIKSNKDGKRATELYGGRKMRKFYPHKIKYKDKSNSNNKNKNRAEFRDYTEEKVSMSIEMPEMNGGGQPALPKQDLMTYKMEPSDSAIWRIDYMKHGVPSINSFGFEDDRLRGKLVKTGPNVVSDDNNEQMRKEVLHPDVYIKKNFVRKTQSNMNSDVLD